MARKVEPSRTTAIKATRKGTGRKPLTKVERQQRALEVRRVVNEELAAMAREGRRPSRIEAIDRAAQRLTLSPSTIRRALADAPPPDDPPSDNPDAVPGWMRNLTIDGGTY